MSIKTPKHGSGLEAVAYEQRLSQLGLVQEPGGTIKPGSMKKVQTPDGTTGADAVAKVVGHDGVLTAGAAAQLDKTKGIIGGLLSKDVPSDEAQTNAVRAVAMACDGLVKSVKAELDQVTKLGLPGKAAVDKLMTRTDHLAASLRDLFASMSQVGIDKDGAVKGKQLGHAQPAAVHKLAKSLGELGGLSSELSSQLSAVRDLYALSPDSPIPGDIEKAKKSLAASGAVFGKVAFVGNLLGDKAAYTVAWLTGDQPTPKPAAQAPETEPKGGAAVAPPAGAPPKQAPAAVRSIEDDFPGINDELYGMSQAEKDAWNSGGAAGLIEHLCGPTH